MRELISEANRYKIPCKYHRENGFEYEIKFGNVMKFKDRRKARKYIDALVEKHKLVPGENVYRLSFGWEIY